MLHCELFSVYVNHYCWWKKSSNHHLGCKKSPVNNVINMDKLPINWCRISSINSIITASSSFRPDLLPNVSWQELVSSSHPNWLGGNYWKVLPRQLTCLPGTCLSICFLFQPSEGLSNQNSGYLDSRYFLKPMWFVVPFAFGSFTELLTSFINPNPLNRDQNWDPPSMILLIDLFVFITTRALRQGTIFDGFGVITSPLMLL